MKKSRLVRVSDTYYKDLKKDWESFIKKTGVKISLVEFTRIKATGLPKPKKKGILDELEFW